MDRVLRRSTLLVVVLWLGSCATETVSPTPEQADPTIQAAPSPTPQPSPAQTEPESFATGPEPIRVVTHCGLEQVVVDFDGALWKFMPVGDLGNGNAPAGFGRNWEDGTIKRLDRDHALFRSSEGEQRILQRQELDPEPSPFFCA